MNINKRRFLKSLLFAFLTLFFKRFPWSKSLRAASPHNGQKIKIQVKYKSTNSKVVSVHSPEVTNWDFRTFPYFDSIRQKTVNSMLDEGIKALTSATTPNQAWERLFHSYRKEDKIAIKPNFNDLNIGFIGFITSPAVINAILNRLINLLGIPANDIFVYDCSRLIPDNYRKRINFKINFIEAYGSSFSRKVKCNLFGNPLAEMDLNSEISSSVKIINGNKESVKCYLPKIISETQHIINVPILKSHQFVLASGALKNHFGTVRFSDGHVFPEYLHPPIIHEAISDINSNKQIAEKTRFIVMDALFGRYAKKGGLPEKWTIFDNKSPNRLYISEDSVAIDSITSSLIRDELIQHGEKLLSKKYLYLSQQAGTGNLDSIDFKEINAPLAIN